MKGTMSAALREMTETVTTVMVLPALKDGAGRLRRRKMLHSNLIILYLSSSKEALIQSLSAFILGFLCNARNGATRIASYLRSPMTKQCIKILIKADSMNESVLP